MLEFWAARDKDGTIYLYDEEPIVNGKQFHPIGDGMLIVPKERLTYGRACDENGSRCGKYRRFDNRKGRDAWVEDGNPYISNPGSREAIPEKLERPDQDLNQ